MKNLTNEIRIQQIQYVHRHTLPLIDNNTWMHARRVMPDIWDMLRDHIIDRIRNITNKV